jgi:hypothetical protein
LHAKAALENGLELFVLLKCLLVEIKMQKKDVLMLSLLDLVLRLLLHIAVAAVNRSSFNWFEGDLCLLSAIAACSVVHLSGAAEAAAARSETAVSLKCHILSPRAIPALELASFSGLLSRSRCLF